MKNHQYIVVETVFRHIYTLTKFYGFVILCSKKEEFLRRESEKLSVICLCKCLQKPNKRDCTDLRVPCQHITGKI